MKQLVDGLKNVIWENEVMLMYDIYAYGENQQTKDKSEN